FGVWPVLTRGLAPGRGAGGPRRGRERGGGSGEKPAPIGDARVDVGVLALRRPVDLAHRGLPCGSLGVVETGMVLSRYHDSRGLARPSSSPRPRWTRHTPS